MAEGRLDELVEQLERTAAELRDGELDSDQAAALVEECARLASAAASELDREARAADAAAAGEADQLALGE